MADPSAVRDDRRARVDHRGRPLRDEPGDLLKPRCRRWWGWRSPRNLACIAAARAGTPQDWWLLAVMALDVLTFSGLLYFTGGPENPFSFLYLVPIAIAAITLRAAWTWMLVLLSLTSSLVLFARHQPLPMAGGHAGHMALHLRGMWVAFGVASAFIVYFLMRVRRALAARDQELDAFAAWRRGRSAPPRWPCRPPAQRTSWPRRSQPSR